MCMNERMGTSHHDVYGQLLEFVYILSNKTYMVDKILYVYINIDNSYVNPSGQKHMVHGLSSVL